MAEELNNSAASCLEIGLYKRAIASLTRALDISKRLDQSVMRTFSECRDCTLDACVSRSQSQLPLVIQSQLTTQRGDDLINRCNISGKPIRVSGHGHATVSTLIAIIMYNLALASHHMAVKIANNLAKEETKIIDFALSTYRFVYENLLIREDGTTSAPTESSPLRSIRFEIIILNNICQMYQFNHLRRNDNNFAYEHYRRRLLSTMMVVVDHNLMATTSTDNTGLPQRIQLDDSLRNTILEMFESRSTAPTAWAMGST